MNIGTILDELGLDALAPGDPDRPDAGPDGPLQDGEEESDEDETSDAAAENSVAESSDDGGSSGGGSGGLFGRGSSDDDDDLRERLNDFEYELDEVRNDVEQNEASIDGLESEQVSIGERMEQIEEHNATLLGVYDHLTEGINPFTDDWDRTRDRAQSASESMYGVIPDGESGDAEDRRLQQNGGATEPAEPRRSERDDPPDDEPEPERADPEPRDDPEPKSTPVPESPPSKTTRPEDGPYLTEFAGNYATDVLVMEWLTMLIETAGEEGALKALDHYERIDWVSESIRRDLEVALSGARSEADAAPRNDLSTDVHDRSFRYIARLSQQTQLSKSARLR